MPELLNMDLLSIFFGFLEPKLVPDAPVSSSPATDRALISLAGLSKLGNFIIPPHPMVSIKDVEKRVLNGWEGVFKWCKVIYTVRIASTPGRVILPEVRRAAMDIVAGVIYSLSRLDSARKIMADTPGCVELSTQLWIIEDDIKVPSGLPVPVCTAALDALLTLPESIPRPKVSPEADGFQDDSKNKETEDKLDKDIDAYEAYNRSLLDRVVEAAGGKVSNVVELAFSRLRTATASDGRLYDPRCAINLDLLSHLSRVPDHAIRLAFLSAGMTAFVTKLAVKIGGQLDVKSGAGRNLIGGAHHGGLHSHSQEEGLLSALVASLVFLYNTLESTDGFTWVVKAVSSGLIQAWVSTVRHMHKLDSWEDAELTLDILSKIVPRYMVYKSVVTAVDGAIKKVNVDLAGGPNEWKYEKAQTVWKDFTSLAQNRVFVGVEMKEVKKNATTCDNVKCQKIDVKNNFRKCSSCSNTFYCSRECQVVAWKEGGHKTVCQLKQQEVLEGKYQSISKTDSSYVHHLSTHDARKSRLYLRRLAESKYPELAADPTLLVISINYCVQPPTMSVHPLSEHEKHKPKVLPGVSINAEARNDELIQRARDNPGKFGVIQSKIPNGQGILSVLTMVTGAFWNSETWRHDSSLQLEGHDIGDASKTT